MGSNGCYTILKFLVVVINLIFWVLGIAVVGLSIWQLVSPSAYISATQDEQSYKSILYVLLAIGLLIFIVGILGCCGACNESQCLLISFFSTLLVVVAAEIAAGAWAYSNANELNDLVKVNFRKIVEEDYGIISSRTEVVDTIQEQLHCCGANSPTDWANSRFNNKTTKLDLSILTPIQPFKIPSSCCKGDKDDILCKTGTQGRGTLPISQIIYPKGCITKLYKHLESYVPIIIAILVIIGILQLLGLILALILCCAVSFVNRYKA